MKPALGPVNVHRSFLLIWVQLIPQKKFLEWGSLILHPVKDGNHEAKRCNEISDVIPNLQKIIESFAFHWVMSHQFGSVF